MPSGAAWVGAHESCAASARERVVGARRRNSRRVCRAFSSVSGVPDRVQPLCDAAVLLRGAGRRLRANAWRSASGSSISRSARSAALSPSSSAGSWTNWDVPISLAVGLGLLIGAAGGLANGLLTVRTGINGFIITLATASVFTGVNFGVTESIPFYNLPARFCRLRHGALFRHTLSARAARRGRRDARFLPRPHRAWALSAGCRRKPSRGRAFRHSARPNDRPRPRALRTPGGGRSDPRGRSTRVGAAHHWDRLAHHLLRRSHHRRRRSDRRLYIRRGHVPRGRAHRANSEWHGAGESRPLLGPVSSWRA